MPLLFVARCTHQDVCQGHQQPIGEATSGWRHNARTLRDDGNRFMPFPVPCCFPSSGRLRLPVFAPLPPLGFALPAAELYMRPIRAVVSRSWAAGLRAVIAQQSPNAPDTAALLHALPVEALWFSQGVVPAMHVPMTDAILRNHCRAPTLEQELIGLFYRQSHHTHTHSHAHTLTHSHAYTHTHTHRSTHCSCPGVTSRRTLLVSIDGEEAVCLRGVCLQLCPRMERPYT